MSRHLYVLRHAKSSWDDPGLDDHERPLAPRGLRSVRMLADHLERQAIHPTLVLCSTARRTRETLEAISPSGDRLIEPELYGATGPDLLDRLRQVPDDAESVMVIGHNPAMQTLVLRLADPAQDGALLPVVQRRFPTGALATLTFECGWSKLAPACARLTDFTKPRSLASS
jgi:phosphohistidine phosphatase